MSEKLSSISSKARGDDNPWYDPIIRKSRTAHGRIMEEKTATTSNPSKNKPALLEITKWDEHRSKLFRHKLQSEQSASYYPQFGVGVERLAGTDRLTTTGNPTSQRVTLRPYAFQNPPCSLESRVSGGSSNTSLPPIGASFQDWQSQSSSSSRQTVDKLDPEVIAHSHRHRTKNGTETA